MPTCCTEGWWRLIATHWSLVHTHSFILETYNRMVLMSTCCLDVFEANNVKLILFSYPSFILEARSGFYVHLLYRRLAGAENSTLVSGHHFIPPPLFLKLGVVFMPTCCAERLWSLITAHWSFLHSFSSFLDAWSGFNAHLLCRRLVEADNTLWSVLHSFSFFLDAWSGFNAHLLYRRLVEADNTLWSPVPNPSFFPSVRSICEKHFSSALRGNIK